MSSPVYQPMPPAGMQPSQPVSHRRKKGITIPVPAFVLLIIGIIVALFVGMLFGVGAMSEEVNSAQQSSYAWEDKYKAAKGQLNGYVNVPSVAPDTMGACGVLFDGNQSLIDYVAAVSGYFRDSANHDAVQAFSGASLAVKTINEAFPKADPDMKASLAALNAPMLKIVYATQNLGYADAQYDSLQVLSDLNSVMESCVAVGYTAKQ